MMETKPWIVIQIRGLPYMTSAQRGEGGSKNSQFADKQSIKFGQRGRGDKKSENIEDVIHGSPLN